MATTTDDSDATGGSEPPPFAPSEDWIEAYAKQCTNALRLDLKEYAKRRARGVGRTGRFIDESYVEDLVADALADTLFGVVTWDHTKKTLQQHAEDVIKFRTRHDRVRARKFKHDRIDAPTSLQAGHVTRALVEVSLRHDQTGETAESTLFAAEVIEQLRSMVGDDEDLHRYLDAIEAGATTRAEIMDAAGLTAKAFRNTRDRLGRLVDKLDFKTVGRLRA